MDRLDAWLTAGPPEVDERGVAKWQEMLRERCEEGSAAFCILLDEHADADYATEATFERVTATLEAMVDTEDERAARVLQDLFVLSPLEADVGDWVDDYYRGQDEDALLASAGL